MSPLVLFVVERWIFLMMNFRDRLNKSDKKLKVAQSYAKTLTTDEIIVACQNINQFLW